MPRLAVAEAASTRSTASTRRAFMRTVASVASISIVAPSIAASSVAEPPAARDPIFAAMERWELAEAAFHAADEESDLADELGDEAVAARVALASTRPTTFTGLAAYLRFLSSQSGVLGTFFFDDQYESMAFVKSLDRALAALMRVPADPATGDAELLMLGASLDVAIAAAASASRDIDAAEAQYEAHIVPGDALRFRKGDELFPMRFTIVDGYFEGSDVEALRKAQAIGWQAYFVAAPEAFERRLRDRAGEIIAAYDAWTAAAEAKIEELGIERLDAEYDARLGEVDRLWKRIANIRATTVEGLAVKARVARFHRARCRASEQPEDMFASDDHAIGCNICDDLAELMADNPTGNAGAFAPA
jgi:hypothetical protein